MSSSTPLERYEQPGEDEDEVDSGSEVQKMKTVVIPYVNDFSEDLRRVCRRYNIRVAFKSSPTLRSSLSKVKDKLPTSMQSNVVYQIPCSCGRVYVGET